MFEVCPSKNGGFFWRLKSSNGETLCHSEVYTTKQAAERGAEAAKKTAATAEIKEVAA